MSARVDHAVVSGTFSLDGETHQVDNNVWVIGDDEQCLVIDAPHDVDAILEVVAGRTVRAIILTHAHDDHCRVAPELRARTGAPIHLHPSDQQLWDLVHAHTSWDHGLFHGQTIEIAGTHLQVLHTPGHAPGAVSLVFPELGCVFTGDTLFKGGPGATGRSFSSKLILKRSLETVLFALAGETLVHPGHGEDTILSTERETLAKDRAWQLVGKRFPGEECIP